LRIEGGEWGVGSGEWGQRNYFPIPHSQFPTLYSNPQSAIRMPITGFEKFVSLQDKIRLALEVCKTLRQDKEQLEAELARAREMLAEAITDNERLKSQVERLIAERDSVRGNIEAMLHEIAKLEMESESLSR
jgi:seryl-tRNA synthetase